MPEINEVKECALNVLRARSELLINRRRQDILDMVDLCSSKDTTVDQDKHARIVEKEGRRRRRRELRNKNATNQVQFHYDGQSSDDELLPSAEAKFRSDNGMLYCIHMDIKTFKEHQN